MADTGDINVGSVIRFNGELVQIMEYQHRTPGNLRAFYQAKMRNLKTGKQTENRFRSGESVEVVRVEYKMMQYIYLEGEFAVVMDNSTYEQVHIPMVMFGEGGRFLKEGMEVKVSFEGDDAIIAEPPTFIEFIFRVFSKILLSIYMLYNTVELVKSISSNFDSPSLSNN